MKYLSKVDDIVDKMKALVPNANKIIVNGLDNAGKVVKKVILIPSKVRQSFYNATLRAQGVVNDIFKKSKKVDTVRPSWSDSEKYVAEQMGTTVNKKPISPDGEFGKRNKKGSTIPDILTSGFSVEVKNYNLSSASNRKRLIDTLDKQIKNRAKNLKQSIYKESSQYIVIDTRGQNISSIVLADLSRDISRRFKGCDFSVGIRFI